MINSHDHHRLDARMLCLAAIATAASPLTALTITRESTLTPGAIFSHPAGAGSGNQQVNATTPRGQSFHLDYGITATALTVKLFSNQTDSDFDGSLTVTFNRLVDGAPDSTAITVGVTGNSPLRDKKSTFYEGGLRVPLIVRRTGVYPAGTVTDRMVHAVDFYRTFCEIAGISAGNMPDRISFKPALDNPATAAQRTPISYHFPGYVENGATPVSIIIKEISRVRYKLIHNYETGGRELYDLTHDLSETRNLLAGNYWDWLLHGAAAQELAADLTAWLTQAGSSWTPKYPTVRATGALLGPPPATVPEVTVPFAQTFRITGIGPAANPDQLTLSWSSGAGFKYAVDGSSDMTVWTPLQENITATSATTTRTITDPLRPTSSRRFYRTRLTHSP